MPTRGEILGFSSEWYPLAYETASPITLPNNMIIRLVTPACFLVTKLAAFEDRGRKNPIASHDLEDVIAVIDGRREIVADVAGAPAEVRIAITAHLEALLADSNAEDLIAAQLLPDAKSQDRGRSCSIGSANSLRPAANRCGNRPHGWTRLVPRRAHWPVGRVCNE